MIGSISDHKISKSSGISPHVILNLREKLGIPAYQRRNGQLPKAALALLGKAPDMLIAKQFGYEREHITHQRSRLEIARFKPGIHSGPLLYKSLYLECISTLVQLLIAHGVTPSADHDSHVQQARVLATQLSNTSLCTSPAVRKTSVAA